MGKRISRIAKRVYQYSILVGLLLIVSSCVLLIVFRTQLISIPLHSYIVEQIAAISKSTVSVERISTNYFNKVYFHNVTVSSVEGAKDPLLSMPPSKPLAMFPSPWLMSSRFPL